MQIFFHTAETPEQCETRWEENKNWQTFEASTWKCHLSVPRFESFPQLSLLVAALLRKKTTQLNSNSLLSFPLRSGISKPVFPTGDALRSVGNGGPLALSSDSWYICLCTGCRCQFSPKRCMAAKRGNTRNAKMTKKDNSDGRKVTAVRRNNRRGGGAPKETKQNG